MSNNIIIKLSGIYCSLSPCSATFKQAFDSGLSETETFSRRDVSFLEEVEHIFGENSVHETHSKNLKK